MRHISLMLFSIVFAVIGAASGSVAFNPVRAVPLKMQAKVAG